MKRPVSIMLIVFGLLTIAYGVVSGGGETTTATPEAVSSLVQEQQAQTTAIPSPSLVPAMPSATPSSTPDWPLATAISFVATETERVRGVNLEISRNNARFADAQSTGNAIRETEIVLTGTAAPLSGSATLAAQQTEVAENIAHRTAEAFAPTATILAAKSDAEAKTAPYLAAGQAFSTFAIGVLALVFAAVAVGAIQRKPAPVVVRRNVTHVQKSNSTRRIPDPPIEDYIGFINWATTVVAGETVAVDHWEQAGRFPGNYRKVHLWLVRWKLVMRHPQTGRAVLNDDGAAVLTNWLIANPLPHHGGSTKTAPLLAVDTESVITEAEGEGLEEIE